MAGIKCLQSAVFLSYVLCIFSVICNNNQLKRLLIHCCLNLFYLLQNISCNNSLRKLVIVYNNLLCDLKNFKKKEKQNIGSFIFYCVSVLLVKNTSELCYF